MKSKSCKIGIVLLIVFIVLTYMLINDVEPVVLIEKELAKYFSENRISLIISFFSVIIAMYITMTSILAISTTKIMEAMLAKSLEKKFLDIIKWSIGSAFLAVLTCVFINKDIICFGFLILFSVVFALFHFIYFFRILLIIFEYNINKMDEEIDELNDLKKELKITLKYIRDEINKNQ